MENKSKILIIIFISIVVIFSCQNKYVNIFGKEIIFPSNNNLYIFNKTQNYNTKSFKLLYYVNNKGCVSCKLQLHEWNNLINSICNITNSECQTILFLNNNHKNIKALLEREQFKYEVIVDEYDSLNKLNHFPSDERFHCFLLDENNKVILIGNPVQNPKIKELYIRTICERLGIDTTNIKIAENQENRFSFGRFPFSETKKTQFVLRNDSLAELKIDTIFTSCECTTAKIDKSVIKNSDSAIISVSFKTDKPEEFSRDVYVKTNLSEKPIVYTVDGVAY